MSSVRGISLRSGRARGNTQPAPARGRGASTTRGRAIRGNTQQRASTTNRGTFGRPSSGSIATSRRGLSAPRSNGSNQPTPQPGALGGGRSSGSWQDRYQALTKSRERERADAIRQGLIADPEKPRSLSDAITPVGTCQEMCAEYERVQRVVQKDVWDEETDPNRSAFSTTDPQPDESRMVKKFRRAAAGLEEQLPSDLRPPAILKRTCDYLFDDVIGNATSLAQVHHFVWDRTRAIRNDFSIQQLTKSDELRIAIECYEKIARFHILSLHQLAEAEKPYSKYDWQQEREQLDRTLLSLMQYYDDSRGRIALPNEAEFRAYCVIFQLQDPTPDLEDRVQSWPREVIQDRRVQKALELYMAACNVMDAQGPLKPRANHLIARQDWQRFWSLISSVEVSYLMACVAEIYFNLVRRMVLNALFRTSRANSTLDTAEWTIDLLCDLLAFDDGEAVFTFCERFGFTFKENDAGQHYLDLTSVRGRTLPEPTAGMAKQLKTDLLEDKRYGRTLPAVINGLSVKAAHANGMVNEEVSNNGVEDAAEEEMMMSEESEAVVDDESLFIPESTKANGFRAIEDASAQKQSSSPTKETPSLFSGFGGSSTLGKPSTSLSGGGSAFPSPAQRQATMDTQSTARPVGELKFDFLGGTSTTTTQPAVSAPAFEAISTKNPWAIQSPKPEPAAPAKSWFGQPSAGQHSAFAKPTSPFGQDSKTSVFQIPSAIISKPEIPSSSLFAPKTENQNLASSQKRPAESLFSSPPAGAPAQTAPAPTFSSQQPETKTSQLHFTTAPAAPPSPPGQPASPPALSEGPKRPSFGHENRPKKPSPLANSFTASDDGSAIESETAAPLTPKPPVKDLFAQKQSQPKPAANETRTNVKQNATDNFGVVLTRLARELVDDDISGYLKQYVEYTIGRTITEVQEQLATERLQAEAADWRKFTLQSKYGKRWKEVFWQRRTLKSGRERRQRRQQRLADRGSEGDGVSLFGTESVRSSRTGSIAGSRNGESRSRQEMVNSMFRQTFSDQRWAHTTNGDQQARSGSKRPLSSHGVESAMPSREPGHKRLKSTSHVDERGRITKPTATGHPNADILKRSSFLGFSLADDGASSRNTTGSNYFRLKAMGLNKPEFSSSNSRGIKRRSDSLQTSPQTSPPGLRSTSLLRFSPEHSSRALMPPPSSAPPHAQKTHDEDEALFARLKAAREGLKESSSFYQSEVAKPDDHRQSLNSSRSSTDSPSMIRARAEARLRASRAASETGTVSDRAVPAYRMRESKFVPRENYGNAIEKSTEFRASRSREPSRPETPVLQATVDPPKPVMFSQQAKSVPNHTLVQDTYGHNAQSFDGPNGTLRAPEVQHEASPFATAPTSFASFGSQGPFSFANHNTQMSTQNPFLQAPGPASFAKYSSQLAFSPVNDQESSAPVFNHTIQPSQIEESLANSFGASKDFGQNHVEPALPVASPTPPQPDSYLHSQAISLLSDDEDDAPTPDAIRQQSYEATEADDEVEQLLDHGYDTYGPYDQYAHSNPYMALARDAMEDEEHQEWQSQVDEGETYDEQVDERQDGYADDEEEDEEEDDSADSDEDESGDADEDEEGNGYEDDEEEDADALDQHKQWQQGRYIDPRFAAPEPNAELQDFGKTAEEAIELSD